MAAREEVRVTNVTVSVPGVTTAANQVLLFKTKASNVQVNVPDATNVTITEGPG